MIALTWQTLLILAVAYFAGCIVGCLARKLVGVRPVVSAEPVLEAAGRAPVPPPPPRYVPRAAAPLVAAEPAVAAPRLVPGSAAQKAFRRADFDTPDDVAPSEEPSQEPAPAPRAPPSPPASPPDVPPPAAVAPPLSAAAAVAAAVAERMAVPTPPVASEPVPEPAAAAAPVPTATSDDLTRIRAIDADLAARLNALGVSRYAEIAAWTSENVRTMSEALGFNGRIELENWIEQAQILARGGATSYATGLVSTALRAAVPSIEAPPPPPERGPEVSTRAAFAEPRPASPSPLPAAAKVSDRDHLQRIGGISGEIESVLNAHDIARYSQIAGWSAADVQRVEGLLGFSGRVSRENWIEQAQILARGGATAYSRTFDERGGPPEPVAVVLPVAAAPAASEAPPAVVVAETAPPPAAPTDAPAERVTDLSGMRSVRSEAFRTPESMASASAAAPDDLKRIRGVGLLIERKLNAMGVSTYEQIANWTADDVSTVNARLEFKGRIERENWIEQARILASGGHTDFSRRFERGEV